MIGERSRIVTMRCIAQHSSDESINSSARIGWICKVMDPFNRAIARSLLNQIRKCSLYDKRGLSTNVFDRQLKRRQWAHCLNNLPDHSYYEYLREESARQITDRLEDITRSFPFALELGSYNGTLGEMIQSGQGLQGIGGIGGIQHLIQASSSHKLTTKSHSGQPVAVTNMMIDEEFLPFKEDSFDLVLSSLHMHWVNDLPSALSQVFRVLKPDGAFIASFLGGNTLQELRHCLYLAELERKGGVSPHCSPLLLASDIAALIQSAGFAMPTVDVDTVTVSYPDAFSLMEHIWKMGEGHATFSRQFQVGRDTFLAMAAIYQKLYGLEDGSVKATFEMIYTIGWKPHASQPKPCKRGSAQRSLKDLAQPLPNTSK